MINKIVGFGDSWIYGNGLTPNNIPDDMPAWDLQRSVLEDQYLKDNCILGQIGKNFNLPTYNYGISGGSLTSTIWEFSKWCQSDVDHQSCLVIIGLTSDTRESWWTTTDDKREYIHSVYTEAYHQWDAKWHPIRKWMTLHSENEKLWQTRYWTALQLFDSFCKINNISLLQVNIFRPTKIFNVNSLHDSTSCMSDLLQLNQRKSNINLIAPCGHPNEQGAKKLADYYTSVVKSKNLI